MVRLGVGEMEQVLSNLMINALDAVDAHSGEIHVQVAEAGKGLIQVVVADNGPGVADDDAPHIFDPFFSTKEIGAGTGLGLAVVYAMVTDAGGTVEVGIAPDLGGARFTVLLPETGKLPLESDSI
jgi:C4-dicarboxylate-specific signal transduction histidine kinase